MPERADWQRGWAQWCRGYRIWPALPTPFRGAILPGTGEKPGLLGHLLDRFPAPKACPDGAVGFPDAFANPDSLKSRSRIPERPESFPPAGAHSYSIPETAGICGVVDNTKLYNLYNTGNIQSNSSVTGGIAGKVSNNSSVRNVYNRGQIQGDSNAGGIIAQLNTNGIVENCYNKADIICGETASGIVRSSKECCREY